MEYSKRQDYKSMARNILITGASSGIGEAVAIDMARSGHNLCLIGRDMSRLQAVKEKVIQLGGNAIIGVGDTSLEADVDRLFGEAMQAWNGRIDVSVLNAGVGRFGTCENLSVADYDIQFNVNVRGVFLWLRLLVPVMKSQGSGQIIAMSSNLGVNTAARCCLYSASKYAVQSMIGCLRAELVGTGVKAATVNPGSVDTPWFDGRDVDRTKMLSPVDVANACRLIIDQSATSDIDMILLNPGKK